MRAATRAPARAARAGGAGAAPAPKAPLGNTAGTPSTPTVTRENDQRRRERRAEAIRWRERLWSWTSLPRLRNCGRIAHTGVGGAVLRMSETDRGRRAGLAGLQSCGSVWACPVCARRIAAQRSAEVRQVLAAVAGAGGSAVLVSLTMRHNRGDWLSDLWAALSHAWGAVTSGRAWTREQERYGILGWLRVVEVTHGAAGWHVHVHAVVCFDGPVSIELAETLALGMGNRWQRALARRGFSAVLHRGGLDVREVRMAGDSIATVADYLSKITLELTSPSTKEGREGNRAPFAILRDALATGLAEDCELWLTWEQASHGRKQLTWSRDIRAWAGLHTERTDEEIVAEDMHGADVLVIPAESWPAVRAEVAGLLDAAEIGGLDAAQRWLTARGLAWSLPRGAPC